MERLTIIDIEWNIYNGFSFEILHIDCDYFDRSLFGIAISKDFFYIDILFFNIKILHPLADDF